MWTVPGLDLMSDVLPCPDQETRDTAQGRDKRHEHKHKHTTTNIVNQEQKQ